MYVCMYVWGRLEREKNEISWKTDLFSVSLRFLTWWKACITWYLRSTSRERLFKNPFSRNIFLFFLFFFFFARIVMSFMYKHRLLSSLRFQIALMTSIHFRALQRKDTLISSLYVTPSYVEYQPSHMHFCPPTMFLWIQYYSISSLRSPMVILPLSRGMQTVRLILYKKASQFGNLNKWMPMECDNNERTILLGRGSRERSKEGIFTPLLKKCSLQHTF